MTSVANQKGTEMVLLQFFSFSWKTEDFWTGIKLVWKKSRTIVGNKEAALFYDNLVQVVYKHMKIHAFKKFCWS